MGPKSLGRLTVLIEHYAQPYPDGADTSTAARAQALSYFDEVPRGIRSFFVAFSREQRGRNSTASPFPQLQQTVRSLRLLECYDILPLMARNVEDYPDLRAFLEKNGYITRTGVDWRSCTISYLSDSLQMDKDKLNDTCPATQGFTGLVEQFCRGIISILLFNKKFK
jgi:hypothetical protein